MLKNHEKKNLISPFSHSQVGTALAFGVFLSASSAAAVAAAEAGAASAEAQLLVP